MTKSARMQRNPKLILATANVGKQRPVTNDVAQQRTWSMFRYFQTSIEWQKRKCIDLGLQYVGPNKTHGGSPDTVLTKPDKRSIKKIVGDGNCLYRSLSYILTGSEDQHFLVRSLI